ncbi:hypothetical protein GCM10007304_14660 [Rhodococcoides trifolii]|uniref:Secreted protein n=1 Tax=Rhodococcoides trifolii TaxID=908250 RepID=A0A917CXT4_9NOCA|nr:hypothetical protein [Rhodococcus trifolii]GGG01733.1 hypothetical protein GCM10007304_14660 [Rhodococcus trifolii]
MHSLKRAAAVALVSAAGAAGIALAGAGTASAAGEPSKGGPIYFESFSTLSIDPDAVPCSERAAANRARGDIILVNCVSRPIIFGTDTVDLIGINVSLGS